MVEGRTNCKRIECEFSMNYNKFFIAFFFFTIQQVAGFAKRKIISCSIEPSQPTVFACNYDKAVETYDYWTVIIKARSFVYRQVRNMIAIMVECATGKLSEREFYEMLTIPSNRNWPKNLETAPAHGLYLKNVEFGSPEEPPEEAGQSQVKEI